MIKHIWSVLCERSIIDQETKLVSIINVIEELTVESIPKSKTVVPVFLSLVSLWTRTDLKIPISGHARVNFVSPDGKVRKILDMEIDLTKYERLRSRAQIQGIPIPVSGLYYFDVHYRNGDSKKWKKVASLPVKVKFKDEPKKENQ